MDYTKAAALIGPFEGRIPHMYLDKEGNVTCGVGNLLRTPAAAQALVWTRRDDGVEADDTQIAGDFQRVAAAVKGYVASAYRPLTTCELIDYEIDRLFKRRVDEFVDRLTAHFPEYPNFPERAQLALLDMAFNMGAGAIPRGWPNLSAAIRAQDWATAAAESNRPEARPARNAAIKTLFETAGQVAAPVIAT